MFLFLFFFSRQPRRQARPSPPKQTQTRLDPPATNINKTQAYLTTRKVGKKFAAYDLSLSLDWEVVAGDGGGEGEGGGDDDDRAPPATTTGSFKVSELPVGAGAEDVLFEAGSGPPETGAAVIAALRPTLLEALAGYAAALNEVEL